MGRGVETFSISRAMALASYTPTQMGSTVLPFTILQDDDGHVGHGIHHQPANFHFDFHDALPNLHYTTVTLSPTNELGPARVTRTGRYCPDQGLAARPRESS